MEQSETERGTTWRQKQRLVREEAILDAARALIGEHGYDAMTMEELADKVGISKPTLYQHFDSKELIAVRAIVELMEQNLLYVAEMDIRLPAMQRLTQFVRWMLTQRFGPEHCFFGGTKAALVPVIRDHPDYQVLRKRTLEVLTRMFEQAKTEKAIDIHLSTRTLIQMLYSLVRDTEYDLLIANKECTIDEVSQTLTAAFLAGVCNAHLASAQHPLPGDWN